MIVYDYIGRRGAAVTKSKPDDPVKGAIRTWRDGLQVAQRGQLDAKLDMLNSARDVSLLPGLMAGPIKGHPHIYKLQVGGKVRLRPFLCRGPIDAEIELTLLAPATERDGRFEPLNAPDQATDRRLEIMSNANLRAKYVFPED